MHTTAWKSRIHVDITKNTLKIVIGKSVSYEKSRAIFFFRSLIYFFLYLLYLFVS